MGVHLQISRSYLTLKPFSESTGNLYVVGPGRIEMKYTTIDLTDELKKMNGSIIECRYVDHHWILVRLRNDRKHPNGRRTVIGTETYYLKNAANKETLI